MKIGVADPNKFKFSMQLINHWQEQGHEIVKHVANLDKHNHCDVVFYEQASSCVVVYSEKMPRQKKVIVRALDIENYMNYYKKFDWDKIDYFIVLNEAHKKLYTEQPNFDCPEEKIKVIQCGVDTDKFTLKKKPRGKRAVFVGGMYFMKNVEGAINLIYELNKLDPGWELYVRGDKAPRRQYRKYLEHRADELGVKVHRDKKQEDMNEYYEDKDLMIVSSYKEAFSYAAAEAMAKGIPTVTNNWYGSKDVWPEWMIYNTPNEGAKVAHKLLKKEPMFFRNWIKEHYPEEKMLERIDRLVYEDD